MRIKNASKRAVTLTFTKLFIIFLHSTNVIVSSQNCGRSYRGLQNVTESGLTCQFWDSQIPQSHRWLPERYPTENLVQNFCRNPQGRFARPICFTTSPDFHWEFCNVPECPSKTIPYVKFIQPRIIGEGGSVKITIVGNGFSNKNFQKTLDQEPIESKDGNFVLLVNKWNALDQRECRIDPDRISKTSISCYTPRMPNSDYMIKVRVDGTWINSHNLCSNKPSGESCVIRSRWNKTPKINKISPRYISDKREINISGKIFTDRFKPDTFMALNEKKSRILRVWNGGQQCEVTSGTALNNNATDDGIIKCNAGGSFVGNQNISFILNDDWGRSKSELDTYNLASNGELYQVQSHAVVHKISAQSVFSSSGQVITISGNNFDEISKDKNEVRIAGQLLEILEVKSGKSLKTNFDQIIARIPTSTNLDIALRYEGNRGWNMQFFTPLKTIQQFSIEELDKIIDEQSVDEIHNNENGYSWVDGENRDNFALKTTSFLQVPATGNYQFFGIGDDNFKLYLENKEILKCSGSCWHYKSKNRENHWSDVQILLKGKKYEIKLILKEYSGNAAFQLGIFGHDLKFGSGQLESKMIRNHEMVYNFTTSYQKEVLVLDVSRLRAGEYRLSADNSKSDVFIKLPIKLENLKLKLDELVASDENLPFSEFTVSEIRKGKFNIQVSQTNCLSKFPTLNIINSKDSLVKTTQILIRGRNGLSEANSLENSMITLDSKKVDNYHFHNTFSKLGIRAQQKYITNTCSEKSFEIKFLTAGGFENFEIKTPDKIKFSQRVKTQGGVFFHIIPSDWLTTSVRKPQVVVTVNGISSVCTGDCGVNIAGKVQSKLVSCDFVSYDCEMNRTPVCYTISQKIDSEGVQVSGFGGYSSRVKWSGEYKNNRIVCKTGFTGYQRVEPEFISFINTKSGKRFDYGKLVLNGNEVSLDLPDDLIPEEFYNIVVSVKGHGDSDFLRSGYQRKASVFVKPSIFEIIPKKFKYVIASNDLLKVRMNGANFGSSTA